MTFRLDIYEEEATKERIEVDKHQLNVNINYARTKALSFMERVEAMNSSSPFKWFVNNTSNYNMGSYATAIGQTIALLKELLMFFTDGLTDGTYLTAKVDTIISALKMCGLYIKEGET